MSEGRESCLCDYGVISVHTNAMRAQKVLRGINLLERQDVSVWLWALNRTVVVDPIIIIPRDSDTINGLVNLTVKHQRHSKRSQDYSSKCIPGHQSTIHGLRQVPCAPVGAEQAVVSGQPSFRLSSLKESKE